MQDRHEGQRVKLCVINTNMTSSLADPDFLLRWGGGGGGELKCFRLKFFLPLGSTGWAVFGHQ